MTNIIRERQWVHRKEQARYAHFHETSGKCLVSFLIRVTGLVNDILLLLFFLLWWEVRRVGLWRPLWEWRKGQERFRSPCLHPLGLLWLNPGRRKLFLTPEGHIAPPPVSGELLRKAPKNSFLGLISHFNPNSYHQNKMKENNSQGWTECGKECLAIGGYQLVQLPQKSACRFYRKLKLDLWSGYPTPRNTPEGI